MSKIGIIGGSGLENSEIVSVTERKTLTTEYGAPSAELLFGKIAGIDIVFLSRHGGKHEYSPTEVNYRANITALKEVGVTHILATTACGSLAERIGRGHFVVLDQFIDFTKRRVSTFHDSFSEGAVHAPMADPFDSNLRQLVIRCGKELNLPTHEKGTVVTIEGPRFSTRAESRMFQSFGGDVINMSVATEVALANEAGLPYAAIAMSTDYDCWKEDEAPVTWEAIKEIFAENAKNVEKLLEAVVFASQEGLN